MKVPEIRYDWKEFTGAQRRADLDEESKKALVALSFKWFLRSRVKHAKA